MQGVQTALSPFDSVKIYIFSPTSGVRPHAEQCVLLRASKVTLLRNIAFCNPSEPDM